MAHVRQDCERFGCGYGRLLAVVLVCCVVSGLSKEPVAGTAADAVVPDKTASHSRSDAFSAEATGTGTTPGEAFDESLLDLDIEQLAREDVDAQVIWKQ